MIQRVDLVTAKAKLEELLNERPISLDVDSLASLQTNGDWKRIPARESGDDVSVARSTGLLDPSIAGDMLLITDSSFYEGGAAWRFGAFEITEVFDRHLEETRERVFGGGDVILCAIDMKILWLFHHEGVYLRIRLA